MSIAAGPEFPVFVVARSVDSGFASAGANMPENTPLSSITVPIQGRNEHCLAWFTTAQSAEEFMNAGGLKGCAVALNSAAEAVTFLAKRQFFGVALNPRGIGDVPTVYPYADFISLFRRIAACAPFPFLMPQRPDGKGILMQPVDGGHLVPLFSAGYSPRAFFLSMGIVTECEMAMFDNRERFAGLLQGIIAAPETFQITGFVLNPAGPDLRGYPAISPADLLAQLGHPKS